MFNPEKVKPFVRDRPHPPTDTYIHIAPTRDRHTDPGTNRFIKQPPGRQNQIVQHTDRMEDTGSVKQSSYLDALLVK